jgi:hypothetical protein
MSVGHEPRQTTTLRLVGIYRENLMVATSRMGHVIGAATKGPLVPSVDQIENERCMDSNVGLKTLGRLPGPVPDTADLITVVAGGVKGNLVTVAGEKEPVAYHAPGKDLQPLEGAVDVADRTAGRRFLPQHMPRLQGHPEFEVDIPQGKVADPRETELEVRIKPIGLEWIPSLPEVP